MLDRKRILSGVVGAALSVMLLTGARVQIQRSGGGNGGDSGGGNPVERRNDGPSAPDSSAGGNGVGNMQSQRNPVVIKMRQHAVPRPDTIRNQTEIIRNNRPANWPAQRGHGERVVSPSAVVGVPHHTSIVRNNAVIRDIHTRERAEIVPNRYYWHRVNNERYVHYYDHNIHWYGFYHGSSFYWTRNYGNRWWWFDARFDRWVYWWDGYWWWPSPGGVAYVYVDNNYYPYEQGVVTVKEPEVQPPAQDTPAQSNEGQSFKSPDDRRLVQVFGERSEAFLYDTSKGGAVFVKYLGQSVEKVRFKGGKNNRPLQILMDFTDGSFAFFDEHGEPLDAGEGGGADGTPGSPITAPPPAIPPPQPE